MKHWVIGFVMKARLIINNKVTNLTGFRKASQNDRSDESNEPGQGSIESTGIKFDDA